LVNVLAGLETARKDERVLDYGTASARYHPYATIWR
jgi:hypothetical protein